MMMTLNIEIPALERLCDLLEGKERGAIIAEMEAEIVDKLKEAATKPMPRPTIEAVPATDTAPEPQKGPSEPITPEPTNVPAAPVASEPEPTPVTLEAVQRAAAELKNLGKLKAVTGLFPEFEIKKLSDLKGDKLQAFAERLRKMGAKL